MEHSINRQIVSAIVIITSFVLYFLGRSVWCPAGDLMLWSFNVQSQHNSQHLLDWYTPSHISHGLLICLLLRVVGSERLNTFGLSLCVLLESGWEILENTDFIIQRYREATMALDYFGDSVLNSLSDIGWCSLGFLCAARLKAWQVLAIFLFFELFTLAFIRDNLTLNVIMLIYPLDAIKTWQMGG
ncbi:DUF2585 family protein [Oligoflexia bacterium]|nr:DUF2585 family protein [Oligoflexia bacterium]